MKQNMQSDMISMRALFLSSAELGTDCLKWVCMQQWRPTNCGLASSPVWQYCIGVPVTMLFTGGDHDWLQAEQHASAGGQFRPNELLRWRITVALVCLDSELSSWLQAQNRFELLLICKPCPTLWQVGPAGGDRQPSRSHTSLRPSWSPAVTHCISHMISLHESKVALPANLSYTSSLQFVQS